MNVTQLRALIAVAEVGSFTAAADFVGVTQSGLSQALAALEEALGVKLLLRQRRGVELTAFGERALVHARAALDYLDAIRQEARDAMGRRPVHCASQRFRVCSLRYYRHCCGVYAPSIPASIWCCSKRTTARLKRGSGPALSISVWS